MKEIDEVKLNEDRKEALKAAKEFLNKVEDVERFPLEDNDIIKFLNFNLNIGTTNNTNNNNTKQCFKYSNIGKSLLAALDEIKFYVGDAIEMLQSKINKIDNSTNDIYIR